MKIFLAFLICTFFLLIFLSGNTNNPYTYDQLYSDLINFDTCGYKARFIDNLNDFNFLFTQGSLCKSENASYLSIVGRGYFKVYDKLNKKYYYTRDGRFETISKNGFFRHVDNNFMLYPEPFADCYTNDTKYNIVNIDITNEMIILTLRSGESRIYRFQLFEPTDLVANNINQDKQYFTFSTVKSVSDFDIIPYSFETSTSDVTSIIGKLLGILYWAKGIDSNEFKMIDYKINILLQLLNIWTNNLSYNEKSSYVLSLVPYVNRLYNLN